MKRKVNKQEIVVNITKPYYLNKHDQLVTGKLKYIKLYATSLIFIQTDILSAMSLHWWAIHVEISPYMGS